MNLNKKIRVIISITIAISFFIASIGITYGEEPLKVDGKAAILIDAGSGEVIYEMNAHEKLSPASVTKIMVLLLAMEALDSGRITLDDQVVISSNAANMGGSQIYLEEGEIQTVEGILRAISLRSANDAAVAIGEHIAGSEELFISMMNDRASELGMDNTNFINPTGLTDSEHYTSAYDIGLMSRELLKHPKVHDWLTLWMSDIQVGKKKDVTQSLNNTNRLIHDYQGANGIKTGFTNDAGFCLSASAKRGNLTLIAIVMGSQTSKIRNASVKKLLDYGFANYNSLPMSQKGEIVKRLPINKGKISEMDVLVEEDFSLLVKKGSPTDVEKELILPKYIDAPIIKNQKIGELILKIEGKEVGRVNLIVKDEVEKASFIDMFRKMIQKLLVTK